MPRLGSEAPCGRTNEQPVLRGTAAAARGVGRVGRCALGDALDPELERAVGDAPLPPPFDGADLAPLQELLEEGGVHAEDLRGVLKVQQPQGVAPGRRHRRSRPVRRRRTGRAGGALPRVGRAADRCVPRGQPEPSPRPRRRWGADGRCRRRLTPWSGPPAADTCRTGPSTPPGCPAIGSSVVSSTGGGSRPARAPENALRALERVPCVAVDARIPRSADLKFPT
jgi:hypothetical protein